MGATSGSDNNGLKIRRQIASGSQELDMMGRLHSDIFALDRYMLNGIDLKIKLTPAKNSFNLIDYDSAIGLKSIITHATLVVRKDKLNPAISLANEKTLTKTSARYPLNEF